MKRKIKRTISLSTALALSLIVTGTSFADNAALTVAVGSSVTFTATDFSKSLVGRSTRTTVNNTGENTAAVEGSSYDESNSDPYTDIISFLEKIEYSNEHWYEDVKENIHAGVKESTLSQDEINDLVNTINKSVFNPAGVTQEYETSIATYISGYEDETSVITEEIVIPGSTETVTGMDYTTVEIDPYATKTVTIPKSYGTKITPGKSWVDYQDGMTYVNVNTGFNYNRMYVVTSADGTITNIGVAEDITEDVDGSNLVSSGSTFSSGYMDSADGLIHRTLGLDANIMALPQIYTTSDNVLVQIGTGAVNVAIEGGELIAEGGQTAISGLVAGFGLLGGLIGSIWTGSNEAIDKAKEAGYDSVTEYVRASLFGVEYSYDYKPELKEISPSADIEVSEYADVEMLDATAYKVLTGKTDDMVIEIPELSTSYSYVTHNYTPIISEETILTKMTAVWPDTTYDELTDEQKKFIDDYIKASSGYKVDVNLPITIIDQDTYGERYNTILKYIQSLSGSDTVTIQKVTEVNQYQGGTQQTVQIGANGFNWIIQDINTGNTVYKSSGGSSLSYSFGSQGYYYVEASQAIIQCQADLVYQTAVERWIIKETGQEVAVRTKTETIYKNTTNNKYADGYNSFTAGGAYGYVAAAYYVTVNKNGSSSSDYNFDTGVNKYKTNRIE